MRNGILTILFAIAYTAVYGQDNRFSIGLEYSPNFVNSTGPDYFNGSSENEFRLAQNAFLLAQYRLAGNLHVSAGFGYLETREFHSFDVPPSNQYDLYKIESHLFHHYLVAPVGLEYKFGSFYVRPEIGIGWNVSNTSLDTYYIGSPSAGGSGTQKHKDENNIHNINSMTYPLMFSFGHEAKLKSCTLILGVKSYYSLNSIGSTYRESGHYYGFGVSFGVRM
jgi:hypothetical protein